MTNPQPLSDNYQDNRTRRCTAGHEFSLWTAMLQIRGVEFCMLCIEEKLPALLDALGVGRIEPEEKP